MKLQSLLLTSACLCAFGAAAQSNYAPTNWRFDQMNVGSAYDIFIPEMASCGWNCSAPFRLADDGRGGVGLANSGTNDESVDNYDSMSDATKEYFEDFYENSRIVATNLIYDSGETTSENILCLIGNSATSTYAGGVARSNSFSNGTLFWLSGNEDSLYPMEAGAYYRFTMDCRVITETELGSIDLTFATSHYDGIDSNTGLASGGYRTLSIPVYGQLSDYWNRCIVDFMIYDNSDSDYKELPFVIKMWLGELADNSVILFRYFTVEKIDAINSDNVPGNIEDYPDYTDDPDGSGSSVQLIDDMQNSTIVTTTNGSINVIGATGAIEVYNLSGAKVATVASPTSVESIDLGMNGVFIVKSGNTVQKVIL